MTGYMIKMNDIRKRQRELFLESWRLREAGFEVTRKKTNKKNQAKNYKRAREIQAKQDELWKKKCFYENYLKEMEKLKNGEN